jgi:hypothetical protein
MTSVTSLPGTDPASLCELAAQAHRLRSLIGALSLIHDASPLRLPNDATAEERQARDAWLPMLELIVDQSSALAIALDRAHLAGVAR